MLEVAHIPQWLQFEIRTNNMTPLKRCDKESKCRCLLWQLPEEVHLEQTSSDKEMVFPLHQIERKYDIGL